MISLPTRSAHIAPLRMSLFGAHRTSPLMPIVPPVILLMFVLAATTFTVRSNAEQSRLATRTRTGSIAVSIDDRVAAYDEVLYGVRGAFQSAATTRSLDRASFNSLIEELRVDERQPGVQVIGAAHLVASDDVESFVARTNVLAQESRLDYPEFELHPPSDASFALPIDYIEPQIGNERAFGLDFLSEPNRRAAALRARDSGRTAATAPVTLVQETGEQQAFLVMLALYRPGASVETIEQRRDAFDGVVYAAFRMGDLMEGALSDGAPNRLAVMDVGSKRLLYGDDEDGAVALAGRLDDRVQEIEVAGRTWRVVVDDSDPVLSSVERFVPMVTVLGGLIVAVLMVALLRSMRSAHSRALEYAAEMTGELKALTESTNEAIVTVDRSGAIVAWNHGATEIFTTPHDEMLGRSVNELVPVRSRRRLDETFMAIMAGADASRTDRPIMAVGRRGDGSEFPAELSLSRWSAHDADFLTAFVRDVTKRVEAERGLVYTTNMLVGVLAAATGVSIIGTDLTGRVSVFNAGAERMLGHRAADVIGVANAADFHDPDEVEGRASELGVESGFAVLVEAARRGRPETRQWTYLRSDGARLPVVLTVTPRSDARGSVCGFIGVAIDITERLATEKRQQYLLDQERDVVAKLREVDRVKNDFVSTMSHELRTPLTSIIGYAELLTDDPDAALPDHSASMLSTITKNAQRLLLLVEDLLALSRIESGSLNATREPCDIGRIIDAAHAAIAPAAASRGITLHVDIDDVPRLSGDAPQLERVFLNLFTNAVKFSHDNGSVEVSVTTAAGSIDGDTDAVDIVVADHGIGIPDDEREHLFTRFFRSRSAEKHAIPGTGLGLAIVANIVERHGGTIAIDSTENVGTAVRLRLPIDPSAGVPGGHDISHEAVLV